MVYVPHKMLMLFAFYDQNQKINEIIARVGKQFNLNIHEELWLNNHVAKQI